MPADTSSNSALAQSLLKLGSSAALGTLDETGGPFASYVITAPAEDLSPLLLLSRLAVHTRNIQRDARASLLFVREPEPDEESMTALRLTLSGRVLPEDDPGSRRLFVARHPDAERYAGFADFSLYRFHVAAGHLVAGFGRIVSLPAADFIES
jgi:putative heme iron utilization protein